MTIIIFDEVQGYLPFFLLRGRLMKKSRNRHLCAFGTQISTLWRGLHKAWLGGWRSSGCFLDIQELQQAGLLENDFLGQMTKGFYPAIYDKDIPSKTFTAIISKPISTGT